MTKYKISQVKQILEDLKVLVEELSKTHKVLLILTVILMLLVLGLNLYSMLLTQEPELVLQPTVNKKA